MKRKHVPVLLLIGFIMAAISGCGGGGGGGDVTVGSGGAASGQALALNANSQLCAACHAALPSVPLVDRVAAVYLDASGNLIPGTNPPTIVAEYSLSLHNVNIAATCQQCHMPTTPNAVDHQTGTALPNPDASAICLNCHGTMGLPHFDPTGTGNAQYVDAALILPTTTGGTQLGCRACHNPHDTSTLIGSVFKDYNAAGHGDVFALPWNEQQFKTSSPCFMCHTTSGFLDRIAPVTPTRLSQVPAGDTTKQTLYCVGCHVDYSYKIRTTGAVTATYSGGTPPATTHTVTFPDVGESNICLNCHVGRENGDSVKLKVANFTNVSFVNSHYLTGGATVYATSGYTYTVPSVPAPGRTYVGPITHSLIGTPAGPAVSPGVPSANGPCASCHMLPARHTFKPVTFAADGTTIASVVSPICTLCHNGATAPLVINRSSPTDLINQKINHDAAMAALNLALQSRGIFFSTTYPYFFTGPNGTGVAVKNWLSAGDTDVSGNVTGKNNMGAAFNYNLFAHDYGAFAHNADYVTELIYDSIDWIDDNILNNSVAATIAASTLTATQKANATTYLIPRP